MDNCPCTWFISGTYRRDLSNLKSARLVKNSTIFRRRSLRDEMRWFVNDPVACRKCLRFSWMFEWFPQIFCIRLLFCFQFEDDFPSQVKYITALFETYILTALARLNYESNVKIFKYFFPWLTSKSIVYISRYASF